MNYLRKIQYNQYWNIGFCEQSLEELILSKELRQVVWLRHPYRDRWFADPFIQKVTEDEIIVFVEECPMENPKGIICELVIDRHTMRLKERYVILEKETHLSYPAIIHHAGKTFVYPENGVSGRLNIYEYDKNNHILFNPICILDEAVADATIIETNGRFFLSATKYPKTQDEAYLYESDSIFGPFTQVCKFPYQSGRGYSRQGGNWMTYDGTVYRPAQNCVERYGASITIMESSFTIDGLRETEYFHIEPVGNRFNLGLHTINFCNGVCVIDGFGHYFPFLGRLYYSRLIRRLVDHFKK